MSACFLSEFDMVQQFEETVDTYYPGLFSRTLEFDSENGIADIVLYKVNTNYEAHVGLSEINPRWALTLRKLPYRKYFYLEEFQELTRCSRSSARKAIESFCRAGYCEESVISEKWIKFRQPSLILKDVVAIEAKLSNWKRALQQARRYLDYANQSWVLIEEKSQKAAEANKFHFVNANIGLASISVEGNIQLLHHPEKSQPRSEFAQWYMNAKIASHF